MTTFLLIRHADNDWAGRRLASWLPGVHLNQKGKEEVVRLTARLKNVRIDAIYSSPLERALETAEPVAAQAGVPVRISEAIGEVRFGDWTGRTLLDLAADPLWQRFTSHRSTVRIPGGELMLDLQIRMLQALEEMSRHHPGSTVAVFSHGDPIRVILMHFLGMPLDLIDRLEIATASISVVTLDDGSPRVVSINVES
jgi:probable phosphoglycerate mutase